MIGYGKLESEGELETGMKDKARLLGWPEKGVIELHNMKLKYAIEYPYVLKSISFKVNSCEKVSHYHSISDDKEFSFVCTSWSTDWHCG